MRPLPPHLKHLLQSLETSPTEKGERLLFFALGDILMRLALLSPAFPQDSREWQAIEILTGSLGEMKSVSANTLNRELQRVCGLLATCFTEIAEAQGERYAQAHPLPEGEPRGN